MEVRKYDRYDKDFKKALWEEGKNVFLYEKSYVMKINVFGHKVLCDGSRDYRVTKKQLNETCERLS